jgi:hypothetical protein
MPSADTTLWAVWESSLWTPEELGTNLALWLDAKDSATVQVDGSNGVTEWLDKSNNDLHAVSITVSKPTYTNNKIVFDGTNRRLQTPLTNIPRPFTFFAIVSSTAGSATRMFMAHISTSNVGKDWLNISSLNKIVATALTSSVSYTNGLSDLTVSSIYGIDNSVTNRNRIFENGVQTTEGSGTTANYWEGATLGGWADGTRSLTGDMSEIILVKTSLFGGDMQKVEGYLAHKWGLTANLPSGHPYKNSPPTK